MDTSDNNFSENAIFLHGETFQQYAYSALKIILSFTRIS